MKKIGLGIAVVLLPALTFGPRHTVPTRKASAAGVVGSASLARVRLAESYGRLPLSFEANRGQSDKRVQFLARGRGYTLFLTGREAVLALRQNVAQGSSSSPAAFPRFFDSRTAALQSKPPLQGLHTTALRLTLVGANSAAKVMGLDELPGKSNYFIGNDPKRWRTNVSNYAKVRYKDVYPGVDLVYYGNQGQLEHDFIVQPGADPRVIRLALVGEGSALPRAAGGRPYQIDGNGDLVIGTDGGELRFHKPVVYQPVAASYARRKTDGDGTSPLQRNLSGNSEFSIHNSALVDGRFVLLADNRVGFEVTSYDRTKPLIIDPVLAYSTYLGGSGEDFAQAIAADSSGNVYVTGGTTSTDFPGASPDSHAIFVPNKICWRSQRRRAFRGRVR